MKKLTFILLTMILIPFGTYAQLGKQMAKYHKKTGVSVTQLDKSLYGLYQNSNLSPEMKEMLHKLDEVNILTINPSICKPEECEKILQQFHNLLEERNEYRLIKSNYDGESEQLVYARSQADKVTDLVVWSVSPFEADIIELRGDIQTDRIALLSRALNINGLGLLATLSPSPQAQTRDNQDMGNMMQSLEGLMSGFFSGLDADFFSGMEQRLKNAFPSAIDSTGSFDISSMLQPGNMKTIEQYFQSLGQDGNVTSNSIQITEENGKTNLKVDSKNSDITYIIDGEQAPKDNVQMPDKIMNVNLIPSKKDIKKSYLLVTSQKQLGTFTSFKEGVLSFRYNNQDYKYNLNKMENPLLVINGRLSETFDIDPASILQIRPLSQVEKEVGYYPHAEVIINTK